METPKRTKAEEVFWTDAPGRLAHISTVSKSPSVEEEPPDFLQLMDENGIIGLSEVVKGDGGGGCGEFFLGGAGALHNPSGYSEGALSSNLGEDTFLSKSLYDSVNSKRALGRRKGQSAAGREEDGDKDTKGSEFDSVLAAAASKKESEKSRTPSSYTLSLSLRSTGVSDHHCQTSHSTPSFTADPCLPHLLHVTAEDIDAASLIEAETCPESYLTESTSETFSLKSSPRPEWTDGPAAPPSDCLELGDKQGAAHPSLRMSRPTSHGTTSLPQFQHKETHLPRAKSDSARSAESRKRQPSYRIPDFSNVKSRICLPDGAYKPPKSRHAPRRGSSPPEPPLVFKSPADIVKEVLLHVSAGSPASSGDCHHAEAAAEATEAAGAAAAASAPKFTVPQDFKSRQQATVLLEQLQENYNTLLIKYAEAENTIDRMRLEAKVNMFADPPKPAYLLPLAANQEASRLMSLHFPQSQRAESSWSPPGPAEQSGRQDCPSAFQADSKPEPPTSRLSADILYGQANQLLQQLHNFRDLLKAKKLKAATQKQTLLKLNQGLKSLEKGYLLAKREERAVQQRDEDGGSFDPDRELEELIFQCGLDLDELKESVQVMPSPPPPPLTPVPQPSEEEDTSLSVSKNPSLSSLADEEATAATDSCSAADEPDGEENTEESVSFFYLESPVEKHGGDKLDLTPAADHQPTVEGLGAVGGAACLTALRTSVQTWEDRKDQCVLGSRNQDQTILPVRLSDCGDSLPSPPVRQQSRTLTPHSLSRSPVLPEEPSSRRRTPQVGRCHSSSLGSLGEITGSKGELNSSPKLQSGSGRVLSQEGIASPGTDSGFVGSESSRLTPAAAASPLHQRATERIQVARESNLRKGEALWPSADPARPNLLEGAEGEGLLLRLDRDGASSASRRARSRRQWAGVVNGTSTADGCTSGGSFVHSDSSLSAAHSVSELEHNDSAHRSGSTSAPQSPPPPSPRDAMHALQAEVSRLQETIKICLRKTNSPKFARVPPSAGEDHQHVRTSTPSSRPAERQRAASRGRPATAEFPAEPPVRMRPASSQKQKQQEHDSPSANQPKRVVSRCTQTSAVTSDNSVHANSAHTLTGQQPSVPVHVYFTTSGASPAPPAPPAPPTPRCCSHQPRQPQGQLNSDLLTPPSRPGRFPRCRSRQPPRRRSVSESRRLASSPPPPAGRPSATALLHCTSSSVPLLFCSSPLLLYPGTKLKVKGHQQTSRSTRSLVGADRWCSVDSSLNRAIRAARDMKVTSSRMAGCLATSLHQIHHCSQPQLHHCSQQQLHHY